MRTFCAAVEKTRPRSIRYTSIVQLRSFPRPRQENAYRRRTGFCIAQFPMRLRKTWIAAIQAPIAQPCIRPAPRSISRGDYTTFAAVRKVPSIRLSLPLAMRTVGAASAADHLAAQRLPADRARLPRLAVNLQKRRVAVFPPSRIPIRLGRDRVLFDEIGKPLRDNGGETGPLCAGQTAGGARRTDLRGEQNLVGIDVADAGDDALLQQSLLHGFSAFSEPIGKVIGRQVRKRFRPQFLDAAV